MMNTKIILIFCSNLPDTELVFAVHEDIREAQVPRVSKMLNNFMYFIFLMILYKLLDTRGGIIRRNATTIKSTVVAT